MEFLFVMLEISSRRLFCSNFLRVHAIAQLIVCVWNEKLKISPNAINVTFNPIQLWETEGRKWKRYISEIFRFHCFLFRFQALFLIKEKEYDMWIVFSDKSTIFVSPYFWKVHGNNSQALPLSIWSKHIPSHLSSSLSSKVTYKNPLTISFGKVTSFHL